uniref:Neuronal tyrosine-phosphorylated phosphoinositide-3-kinase adapter N-terminal domain-containing protein n=1 Tax=Eptatretus burgeri TaxID=7764 RepID=A0A8C4NB40_EPTBU
MHFREMVEDVFNIGFVPTKMAASRPSWIASRNKMSVGLLLSISSGVTPCSWPPMACMGPSEPSDLQTNFSVSGPCLTPAQRRLPPPPRLGRNSFVKQNATQSITHPHNTPEGINTGETTPWKQWPSGSSRKNKVPPPKPTRNPNTQLTRPFHKSSSALAMTSHIASTTRAAVEVVDSSEDDEEPVYIEMVGEPESEDEIEEGTSPPPGESEYEEMKYYLPFRPLKQNRQASALQRNKYQVRGRTIPPPFPDLLSHKPPLLSLPAEASAVENGPCMQNATTIQEAEVRPRPPSAPADCPGTRKPLPFSQGTTFSEKSRPLLVGGISSPLYRCRDDLALASPSHLSRIGDAQGMRGLEVSGHVPPPWLTPHVRRSKPISRLNSNAPCVWRNENPLSKDCRGSDRTPCCWAINHGMSTLHQNDIACMKNRSPFNNLPQQPPAYAEAHHPPPYRQPHLQSTSGIMRTTSELRPSRLLQSGLANIGKTLSADGPSKASQAGMPGPRYAESRSKSHCNPDTESPPSNSNETSQGASPQDGVPLRLQALSQGALASLTAALERRDSRSPRVTSEKVPAGSPWAGDHLTCLLGAMRVASRSAHASNHGRLGKGPLEQDWDRMNSNAGPGRARSCCRGNEPLQRQGSWTDGNSQCLDINTCCGFAVHATSPLLGDPVAASKTTMKPEDCQTGPASNLLLAPSPQPRQAIRCLFLHQQMELQGKGLQLRPTAQSCDNSSGNLLTPELGLSAVSRSSTPAPVRSQPWS